MCVGKVQGVGSNLDPRCASLKAKGQIYKACVQRVLMYGSETWPLMKMEDMQRLERTERMMVRWMCSVSLKNKISSVDLNGRLGLEEVADIVRRGRLRWFGHLERKGRDDWVSTCRSFEVTGPNSRDRHKKTWDECVRQWSSFGGNRPTCASVEKWTLNR